MTILMVLAAAGSGAAAARPQQPGVLRLAHLVMAGVMLAMLGPPAAMVLGLVVAAGVVPLVVWHWSVRGSGLACAVDLTGMALLLAVLLGRPQPRIVVLAAAGWVIASLWAHAEAAARRGHRARVLAEAVTALIGVLAMVLMA